MDQNIKYGQLAAPPRRARVRDVPNLPGYEWVTQSFLRHAIFDAKERIGAGGTRMPSNGLNGAIIRIGRRVLLDLDTFDAWVNAQRERE